jgi:Uncharacterized conserved protein
MPFDYKKEYKEFYAPKDQPSIIEIPSMNFIAVHGKGNPNAEDGEYAQALELLYGVAYTIKMSYKGPYQMEGYFDYVVPPLEGLWWQEGIKGVDLSKKDAFCWISMIRLPEFVKKEDVDWAVKEVSQKKKKDFSKVEFFTYNEGLCVQCMHIGSYDEEIATVSHMDGFALENGCQLDFSDNRYHHEIYLGDPRKTEPSKLKTVLRHPIRKT